MYSYSPFWLKCTTAITSPLNLEMVYLNGFCFLTGMASSGVLELEENGVLGRLEVFPARRTHSHGRRFTINRLIYGWSEEVFTDMMFQFSTFKWDTSPGIWNFEKQDTLMDIFGSFLGMVAESAFNNGYDLFISKLNVALGPPKSFISNSNTFFHSMIDNPTNWRPSTWADVLANLSETLNQFFLIGTTGTAAEWLSMLALMGTSDAPLDDETAEMFDPESINGGTILLHWYLKPIVEGSEYVPPFDFYKIRSPAERDVLDVMLEELTRYPFMYPNLYNFFFNHRLEETSATRTATNIFLHELDDFYKDRSSGGVLDPLALASMLPYLEEVAVNTAAEQADLEANYLAVEEVKNILRAIV